MPRKKTHPLAVEAHAAAVHYACDILEILCDEFRRELEREGADASERRVYGVAFVRTRDLIHEIAGTKW